MSPQDGAVSTAPTPEPGPAAPRGKTLLVLGGTGFLGPHVIDAALASGWTVTMFNRGKTRPELFPDIEKLQGDRDGKLDALKGRQWQAVIDTSGYVPRIVQASAELLASNVEQYLFVSSVSAYASFAEPGIVETAPVATMPDPKSEDVPQFYGALKARCEAAAEAAMPGRVINVRPGLIVGPGDPTDRFTYWPVRVQRGGEVLAPGNPTERVQFIDVRDLATWMVRLLDERHVGIFNAVGPEEPVPMQTLLDTCKQAAGSDARFTWVPAAFLAEHKVAPWSDMPVWVPTEDPESAGFAAIDSSKARATGLTYRSVADTVDATLKWWATLPEERRNTLRAGLPAEREATVLAAWHANAGKGKKGSKGKKPAKAKASEGDKT